jgi:hypothetical protein
MMVLIFIHKVAKGRLETMSFARIFVNLRFEYLLLTSKKKLKNEYLVQEERILEFEPNLELPRIAISLLLVG